MIVTTRVTLDQIMRRQRNQNERRDQFVVYELDGIAYASGVET
jgi:hypothetical protein